MECKIVDLVGAKKVKPIEFLACLQEVDVNKKEPFFYFSNYDLNKEKYETVYRCGIFNCENKRYDLIVCKIKNQTSSDIFLGNWNDGVF